MTKSLKTRLGNHIAWNHFHLHLQIQCRRNLRNSEFYRLVAANKEQVYDAPPRKDDRTAPVVKKSRNILYVIYWYELGGAESYALHTIRLARNLGHKCFVISSVPGSGTERRRFERYCVETVDISDIDPETGFSTFISDFVAQKQIDIIHIHHSASMYRSLPRIRAQHPDLRILDSTHIVEYEDGGFPALSAQYSDFIDRHNVISHNLIAVQKKLYRVQNGHELSKSKFSLTYLSSMTGDQSVEEARDVKTNKHITFYGRFVRQKQPNLFIAVMEHLFAKHPDLNAKALVYGDGEMESLLLKRIARSRFNNKFEFFGRCDDKSVVFRNTDILFIPSLNEGLSLTSFEALAFNRLTVSSDVGAQSELLCGECLVPFSPSFIEDAADRLYMFLTDEDMYRNALSKNLANLARIRNNEANERTIELLYSFH